jgi:hypothetical protein
MFSYDRLFHNTSDKRLDHTFFFDPKFVATEINEIAMKKLFGEFEIKERNMSEKYSDIMK